MNKEQTAIQKALSILDEEEKHSSFEISTETMRIHLQELLMLKQKQIVEAVEWNYKSNMGEIYYKSKFNQ